MASPRIRGVILDVDGTLVDSNDAHARAWVDAFREFDFDVPYQRVRPLIGMGGDNLLPEAIRIEKDSSQGEALSKRRGELEAGSGHHPGRAQAPSARTAAGADGRRHALRHRGGRAGRSANHRFPVGRLERRWIEGAIAVYDGPWDLLDRFEASPFARDGKAR